MIIDTRNDLGDVVYFMINNKIERSIITGVMIERHSECSYNKTFYFLKDYPTMESILLFSSKEELIKHL